MVVWGFDLDLDLQHLIPKWCWYFKLVSELLYSTLSALYGLLLFAVMISLATRFLKMFGVTFAMVCFLYFFGVTNPGSNDICVSSYGLYLIMANAIALLLFGFGTFCCWSTSAGASAFVCN